MSAAPSSPVHLSPPASEDSSSDAPTVREAHHPGPTDQLLCPALPTSPAKADLSPTPVPPARKNRRRRTRSRKPLASVKPQTKPPPPPSPAFPSQPPSSQSLAASSPSAHGLMRRTDAGKLPFQVQLATGSPTGLISGFKSAADLYAQIAETYDLSSDDILYCTLNTHKVDMGRILGSQIGLNDFIFAHVKGTKKEVEVEKTEPLLGITISDNGKDKCFIKRMKPQSVIAQHGPAVAIGDHIEKIEGEWMVGKRHFEVARRLKAIPVGSRFSLRLIEPLKAGLVGIGPRSERGAGHLPTALNAYGAPVAGSALAGGKTLRFRGGVAVVEEALEHSEEARVEAVAEALESYLGVSDGELARSVWEAASECGDPSALQRRMAEGELAQLDIPRDLVFDLWGIVTDARRLGPVSTAQPPSTKLSLPPPQAASLQQL